MAPYLVLLDIDAVKHGRDYAEAVVRNKPAAARDPEQRPQSQERESGIL